MKVVITSGKRKRAIARASLKPGKGRIRINKILLEAIPSSFVRNRLLEPLMLSGDLSSQVDIDVSVAGGGSTSQAEAARLVIAKSLVQFSKDKQLEQKYLAYDRHLLVADVRRKETRKPNDSKARAKRQKSYR
ncbi:30S ribosomal protein S9 [Candidatus Woesearchaeota archaeon]|nr:30S ribosomal protein S9 [Candidatus Woesearchaeota archaeon]